MLPYSFHPVAQYDPDLWMTVVLPSTGTVVDVWVKDFERPEGYPERWHFLLECLGDDWWSVTLEPEALAGALDAFQASFGRLPDSYTMRVTVFHLAMGIHGNWQKYYFWGD